MAADPGPRGRTGSGRVGGGVPPLGADPELRRVPGPAAADHYQVLGVPYAASGAEIARAYRAAMKRIHPDRQPAGGDPRGRAAAEEAARRLNLAYATLSKPLARQAYDRTIRGAIVQDQIMSRYVGGFHVPQANGTGGADPLAPPPRRAPTASERRERRRADRDALVSLVAVFAGMALLLVLLLLIWAAVAALAEAVV